MPNPKIQPNVIPSLQSLTAIAKIFHHICSDLLLCTTNSIEVSLVHLIHYFSDQIFRATNRVLVKTTGQ
jgi:hypothetical protein